MTFLLEPGGLHKKLETMASSTASVPSVKMETVDKDRIAVNKNLGRIRRRKVFLKRLKLDLESHRREIADPGRNSETSGWG